MFDGYFSKNFRIHRFKHVLTGPNKIIPLDFGHFWPWISLISFKIHQKSTYRKTAASFVVTWFVINISATVHFTVEAGHGRCSDKDYFFNQKIGIKSVHSSLNEFDRVQTICLIQIVTRLIRRMSHNLLSNKPWKTAFSGSENGFLRHVSVQRGI